jgi:lipopolysaccharide heptosyltransferase I
MPQAFKNILIIKPSSLGDVVMALPALTALREGFPDGRISWLIRPQFAPLIENHPHLNEVILFDRKLLGKAWCSQYAFASLLNLVRHLRKSQFDAVIDLQGLFRTAVLARLSRCKNRLGMANAREFAHLFYSQRIPQDDHCIHVVDYYLKIIEALSVPHRQPQFIIPQDKAATDSVKGILANYGADPDNVAVLIPTSRHKWKCWPLERFAALAEKIHSQFHFSIVATGIAAEKPLLDELTHSAAVPIANLASRLNLRELVELLRAAKLVASNDTGPGHIAAALGTPLVMLFGPSNPARLAPYGRPECLVDPYPAGRGREIDSPDPRFSITNISLDQVYQRILHQLNQ